MYWVLNKKSYWLIEKNIRKTLPASAFSLIVLNLAEKAVLHFLLIILDYINTTLWRKQLITSNAEHLKGKSWKHSKHSFLFHYNKFSQQKYFTRSYYYKCVTRGRKEKISPVFSGKLEKGSLILGKGALIVAVYWLNFSLKVHLLSFSVRKKQKVFPAGSVLLVLQMNVYQSS